MSSELYERTIPLSIVTFLGTWMIAEYFFQPLQALIPITDTIRTYATVLASASWGLGIAVLTIAHIRAVYQQRVSPHWGYSVIYLVSFAAMALAGLFQGTSGPSFLWGYDHIFAPSHQALYSTTAFFITSAGFRIFRFRNLDSTILLLCGTFVLMSVLPIFTGFIPQLSDIGGWIMNVPGVAGYRAFTIGVALGTIGLGIRIFLHRHPEVLR